MTSAIRLGSAVLLAGYAAFLGVVWTEYNPTAAMLNTAMFAPLSFLAALTFPRHPWANP